MNRNRRKLVQVALNYDRVLEDRVLTHELLERTERPGRLRQLAGVAHYLSWNALRFVTGNLRRYGRVHVTFGAPVSLRAWLAAAPDTLDLPKEERLPRIQALADEMLERIAQILPVTPVPLVAAAILAEGETAISRDRLLERIDAVRDELLHKRANLVHPERTPDVILDRAWRTLRMRRLVVRHGQTYVVLPKQRPLLEYYANSLEHFLPERSYESVMHPAHEPDRDLPSLGRWRRAPGP